MRYLSRFIAGLAGFFSFSGFQENRFEKRLQIVLNSMPVPVTYARLEDQRIKFWNRKFTEVFGYEIGDFETVAEWVANTYVKPEHRKRAEEAWYEYFGSQVNGEFEINTVEVDVLCKDGTVKTTLHGGVILPKAGWALATFVDITELKRKEETILRLSREDVLSRLPNRRFFEDILERSISRFDRDKGALALLILDLDNFKKINDEMGHAIGDEVLKEAAQRLKNSVRPRDFVARVGGDEFAVIIFNTQDRSQIESVCDRIIKALSQPMQFNGSRAQISVSIGVGMFPSEASEKEALYRTADQALYSAKDSGRGCWSFVYGVKP